jgi:hypothetical protein
MAANRISLKPNFYYLNNVLLKKVVKFVIEASKLLHFYFVRFNTLLLVQEHIYDIFLHFITSIRFLIRY